MPLSVLTDEEIQLLLESLTCTEANQLADNLLDALKDYSNGTLSYGANQFTQPERAIVQSPITGATSLFMPSCSSVGYGVKVVTLPSPSPDPTRPPVKSTGSVTLFSQTGELVAVLHARTLTGFRTALASTCLLRRRTNVRTLTVFGSGLQAYWHIRLALMLRGSSIRHINIINRRQSTNLQRIVDKFHAIDSAIKQREGWESVQFNVLMPDNSDYNRLKSEYLNVADVIYCCTPSTEDLFDADQLKSAATPADGKLVAAIGSYKPHMRELPKELLLRATNTIGTVKDGAVLAVDTIEGVMAEAGEVIDAGIKPSQLAEICLLLTNPEISEKVDKWLGSGDVVYKGVGMGLMDLVIGLEILRLAQERGQGARIEHF